MWDAVLCQDPIGVSSGIGDGMSAAKLGPSQARLLASVRVGFAEPGRFGSLGGNMPGNKGHPQHPKLSQLSSVETRKIRGERPRFMIRSSGVGPIRGDITRRPYHVA